MGSSKTSAPTGETIMSLTRGFMTSRVLLTGAELNVFTLLSRPKTVAVLIEETGWHERPLTMLLDALTALGVLQKEDGTYRTEPDLVPLLSTDSRQSILPMMLHMNGLWNSWSRLTPIVKETGGPEGPGSVSRSPEAVKAFIGAMAVAGAPMAAKVVQAVDPGRAGSLLDIGGGPGVYTLAFLKAVPGIRVTLFDKPDVIEMARERIEAEGFLDRVQLTPGDFYRDDLPGGHDLALLSAIIHQNSDQQNRDLYKKAYQALNPGGRLIIRDHVMDRDRTSPARGTLFAINMLVNTPGGGTYTFEEIESGLKEAGFTKVVLKQGDKSMDGLVEAVKPIP